MDYLRARIEALEKEVIKLEEKIAFLEANLEVSKGFGYNFNTDKTINYETR